MSATADRALASYESVLDRSYIDRPEEFEQWERILRLIRTEWDSAREMAGAAGNALSSAPPGNGMPE